MSGAQVNAGLDLAMDGIRRLPDGRRWLLALQATNGGSELFGGRRIVKSPGLDILLGAWAGTRWEDWKRPTVGVRAQAEF